MSKLLPLFMQRTRNGLSPASPFDAEELERVPVGATVEILMKQRRSLPHHRFFFATLSRLVQAGAVPFNTTDEFLDALKMSCGITQLRQSIGGAPYYVPGSISFAAKDEPAFKAFKDRAFALIAHHYGVNPDEVLEAA